jgi:hypothetical protein
MQVDKKTFKWGDGCFMRSVGACDVLWSTQGASNKRATIINGLGQLCEHQVALLPHFARVPTLFLYFSQAKY